MDNKKLSSLSLYVSLGRSRVRRAHFVLRKCKPWSLLPGDFAFLHLTAFLQACLSLQLRRPHSGLSSEQAYLPLPSQSPH